jgi:hypothetical protein
MKTLQERRRQQGFMIRELVVVALCLVLLALFYLVPYYIAVKRESKKVQCQENLKEIVIASFYWVEDQVHNEFPFWLTTNKSGTMEYQNSGDIFLHFLVISNQLKTPKPLVCPADDQRKPAINFASLRNTNLSYFISLKPPYRGEYDIIREDPIFGDRNIIGGLQTNHHMLVSSNVSIQWTSDLHNRSGNVMREDGSVSTYNTNDWNRFLKYAKPFSILIP